MLFTLTFVLMSCYTIGQNQRIIELFNTGLYSDIVSYYDSNKVNQEDLIIVTDALLSLGNNQKAIEINKTFFNARPNDPEIIKTYYKTLIYAEKYNNAYSLVESTNSILPKALSDSLQKDIKKFLTLENDKTEYVIRNLEKVNSAESEFNPVVFNNTLYFFIQGSWHQETEERKSIQKIPLTELSKTTISQEGKVQLNGFTSTKYVRITNFCVYQNEIFFTAVHKKNLSNLIIVHGTIGADGIVTSEKELEICSNDYSVANPSISDDGTMLFFASDMPGGYGKSDIYVTHKTDNGWGKPKNLGHHVNTSGRESYVFYKDSLLFFSSDGHPGYGRRDIFKVIYDQQLDKVENLKAPINSPFDDFGIFFSQDDRGYFSSNRPGGMGEDDIYSFGVNTPAISSDLLNCILIQNESAIPYTKIVITDKDRQIITTTVTNESGSFTITKPANSDTFHISLTEKLDSKNLFINIINNEGLQLDRVKMNSEGIFILNNLND